MPCRMTKGPARGNPSYNCVDNRGEAAVYYGLVQLQETWR